MRTLETLFCTVGSLIIQTKLWRPNYQAGWNGGYHLQASTKLIIKCCLVEAGPFSMHASSMGCGQRQQCGTTEEGCFCWQFWHSLYRYRGVGELRKRQALKAGANLYLSTVGAAWFGQSNCSAAEESLVWGCERVEQHVGMCACTCTGVLGWKAETESVVLKWLNQVTLIARTQFVPLPFQNVTSMLRKD